MLAGRWRVSRAKVTDARGGGREMNTMAENYEEIGNRIGMESRPKIERKGETARHVEIPIALPLTPEAMSNRDLGAFDSRQTRHHIN